MFGTWTCDQDGIRRPGVASAFGSSQHRPSSTNILVKNAAGHASAGARCNRDSMYYNLVQLVLGLGVRHEVIVKQDPPVVDINV